MIRKLSRLSPFRPARFQCTLGSGKVGPTPITEQCCAVRFRVRPQDRDMLTTVQTRNHAWHMLLVSWWLLAVVCSAGTDDFWVYRGLFLACLFCPRELGRIEALGNGGENMSVGYRSCKKGRTVLFILLVRLRRLSSSTSFGNTYQDRLWKHLSKLSLSLSHVIAS